MVLGAEIPLAWNLDVLVQAASEMIDTDTNGEHSDLVFQPVLAETRDIMDKRKAEKEAAR